MTAPSPTMLSATAVAESLVPQLAAAEPKHDREGVLAEDNLRLLTEAGLLTLNIPREHGGLGERLSGTIETLRILAQGSPSTALMLAMHTSTLSHYLLDAVDEEQRAWAYREAVNGKLFGVANSEAGAGGNVKHSRAEVRDGRVFGAKSFCSMGTRADYFMFAARDPQGVVDYWLVANENVSVDTPWNAVGMRSSESVSLKFDGAPVVGPLAHPGLLEGVNNRHWATLSFTAIFTGIAESLLAEVSKQKSGILQATNAVDLHLTLQACRAFLRHCVETEPAVTDDAYRKLVRDCKLYVTRSLAREASAVWVAQGGSSYRFDSSVSRKLRDLMAGPALRPPVGVSFDELWDELAR
ncbi:MAG TPA: acyl-CoA dehydrogenase family protein [Thermoanaerobaculia bacterium]